jgi:hypothetical protein
LLHHQAQRIRGQISEAWREDPPETSFAWQGLERRTSHSLNIHDTRRGEQSPLFLCLFTEPPPTQSGSFLFPALLNCSPHYFAGLLVDHPTEYKEANEEEQNGGVTYGNHLKFNRKANE